jgi:hypothetical protein
MLRKHHSVIERIDRIVLMSAILKDSSPSVRSIQYTIPKENQTPAATWAFARSRSAANWKHLIASV